MSRPWIVLEFGGTSVATADCWSAIAGRSEGATSNLRERHRTLADEIAEETVLGS